MLKELLEDTIYFGVLLSLGSYAIGVWLRKRTGWALMNPLFISIVLVIGFLVTFDFSYESYARGADIISYLLTPATVCLAVPLYQQAETLKKNYKAVLCGVTAGVLSSLCCILTLAILFSLDHTAYVTLLPKSITTAIGMGVTEELRGYVPVAVIVIIITGVIGNVFAEQFLRLIRVKEPIAKGIAIGSSSHAVGTARAMEMGEIEGAMSSLSIVVCGLLTVIGANVFALFY